MMIDKYQGSVYDNETNFVNYIDHLLSTEDSKIIIKKLEEIYRTMHGRACFSSNLPKGGSTPFLVYGLKDYFKKNSIPFETYLEIGVLWGGSIMALYESGFSGNVYGCDIYKGYYGDSNDSDMHKQTVIDNCKKYKTQPILLQGDSKNKQYQQYIENYGLKNIDVLLIDGDHSYEGAYSDFCLFSKFVRNKALILFDNYEDPGVKKAVEKALTHNNLKEHGVWRDTCWVGEYIYK